MDNSKMNHLIVLSLSITIIWIFLPIRLKCGLELGLKEEEKFPMSLVAKVNFPLSCCFFNINPRIATSRKKD
jgi:hypothetical protein